VEVRGEARVGHVDRLDRALDAAVRRLLRPDAAGLDEEGNGEGGGAGHASAATEEIAHFEAVYTPAARGPASARATRRPWGRPW
jgi:hypothetical protein